jgi:hypothetical protein
MRESRQRLTTASSLTAAREVVLEASPSAAPFYEQLGYGRLEKDGFTRGEAVFRYVRMKKVLRSPER